MKPFKKKSAVEQAKPKRIVMYIEDEEDNRRVAHLRLKKDYELLLASSSREACAVLKDRSDEIEAIMMDIELQGSELDGIMLTKLIRGTLKGPALPEYAQDFPVLDTPIVFVTAYGDRYSEEELKEAGGNQLIKKPVDFVQLTMALTQIRLERSKRRLRSREN